MYMPCGPDEAVDLLLSRHSLNLILLVRVVISGFLSDYCLAAGLVVALAAALAVSVVEPRPDFPLLMVLGGI